MRNEFFTLCGMIVPDRRASGRERYCGAARLRRGLTPWWRAAALAPLLVPLLVGSDCAWGQAAAPLPGGGAPDFLYVWGTAFDTVPAFPAAGTGGERPKTRGVLMLTVDIRAGSATLGQIVHAVVADTSGRSAHHTEHALAEDGLIFANDFATGRTYRFDVRAPGEPRLLGHFTSAGPLEYPHSFVRLANGNVLATYQWQGHRAPPGGLAEFTRDGELVRWAHARADGVDPGQIHPYSLEVVPALDRVVTTSTSMFADAGMHVQVWRLSDLSLLHTLELPRAGKLSIPGDHGGHGAGQPEPVHHLLPGEPRLLADGRTIMLGTFTCGVYTLTGVDSTEPRLTFLHAFPGDFCAVPVRIGRWWLQTVPALHAVVVMDVSDPAAALEASRLAFGEATRPHWLAADESGRWIVVNSGSGADPMLYLARFDEVTGMLERRPDLAGIDLSRVAVPTLGTVLVAPHGVVFSRGVGATHE